MLVLSRKKGESLIIHDDIEITILGVEGDNVRLGISAPRNVEIYRKELYLSIRELNQESVAHSSESLNELVKLFQDPPK
jgi:carbon storage regulator